MNKKRIAIGIGILVAVLAVLPTASAIATLHFVPQHSNVSGYGDTTTVEIHLSLSEGDNVKMGQFGFSYDPLCGDITNRVMNTGYPPDYPIDASWSSWNTTTYPECWNGTMDWIVFLFWYPHDGPEDILIGTITLEGNSTEYCTNEMNFGYIPGCSQGDIILWNGSYKEVPYSIPGGTFECGTPPPPQTFEKDLAKGWNLISLPLHDETDMTVANIIDESLSGSYDALYQYDASTPSFVSLSSADTMENGVGYFINMTAVDTWSYSGEPCKSIEIVLSQGLNCVGWINETGSALPDALNSIDGDYNYVARWDANDPKYGVYDANAPLGVPEFIDFETMERGNGYWIAAKRGCTLTAS